MYVCMSVCEYACVYVCVLARVVRTRGRMTRACPCVRTRGQARVRARARRDTRGKCENTEKLLR